MSQAATDAQAARAEATRCRILEVAHRLFRTLGYQKTAVADIARDLGMSPANIYRFYPSKSAINEAIAEQLLGAMAAEMQGIVAAPGTAAERLRRLTSTMFERKIEVFFSERRLHDMVSAAMQEHWGVIDRYVSQTQAAIRRVLEDGMASGEFAQLDPAATAEVVVHALVPWNHPQLVEGCLTHRGQTVDLLRRQVTAMTDFILRALRP